MTRTKCLRVIRASSMTPTRNYLAPGGEVWLYIREYENGQIKYAFCNAPANINRSELDRAATIRWPIEHPFEECKSYLGMDHYETRSWNAWHLYMLLVLISHLFLV